MKADQELFGDQLPTYLTRFVGREQELSELTTSVAPARSVTICGVGGAGKTRLAVEFARRLSRDPAHGGSTDGVVWVPLVGVSEPEAVPHAVAVAIGLREAAGGGTLPALLRSLEERRLLLVLDHCEQIADACAVLLDQVLRVCPRVSVLATSRRPLEGDAETQFGIPTLGVDERTMSDAVALFLDRGRLTTPRHEVAEADSTAIRDICEGVGGSPLAIELVASWIGVLSPRDVWTRLCRTGDVLGSEAPPVGVRHSSVDSVLDCVWSWLAAEDRRVLCDLSVFPGDFDRPAAEAVAGASLASLSVLTDRFLIQRMPDGAGGSRYHVHELVRDYAAEGLTARGDEAVEEVRARHSDFFRNLASQAAAARDTEDEQPALVALEVDQANVDAALVRAVAAGQVDQALQLSSDLASLWIRSAPLERSAALLTRVLDLPWEPSSQSAVSSRARALNLAGYTALAADDCDLAELRFQQALTLSEQLADTRSAAQSLRGLGSAKGQSGDTAAGETSVQRSLTLCRSIGDDPGVAWSRYALGQIAFACGRVDEAAALLAEAVAAFARLGIGYGSYRAHAQLGELHSRRGSLESALASFGQAVVIQDRRLFVACGAEILEGIAGVAARMRRFELAATLLGAGESWREAFDRPRTSGLQPEYASALHSTVRQLGPAAFGRAYEDGRRRTAALSQALLGPAVTELSAGLSAPPVPLTGREVEVLRLVALGLSNAEIAAQLNVSPRTVHAHLRSIFDKLGVTTRTAAAHEAARIGIA